MLAPCSVAEALAWAIPLLTSALVPSPRLDAEVLLADVLHWRRSRLYARGEQPLDPEQVRLFVSAVVRRAEHEPVPYIIGRREFFALDFRVDGRVLIPRPETELLVERVLAEAPGMAAEGVPVLIADIGTGSGIIAISIAACLPRAVVTATDISWDALCVAAHNAGLHNTKDRVHLVQGDLLGPLTQRVHVIAANLPYVPSSVLPSLARDVVAYEPMLALDGGDDGLRSIERLLRVAGRHLLPRSMIVLEIGAGQGDAVISLARRFYPNARTKLHLDYAEQERIVEIRL